MSLVALSVIAAIVGSISVASRVRANGRRTRVGPALQRIRTEARTLGLTGDDLVFHGTIDGTLVQARVVSLVFRDGESFFATDAARVAPHAYVEVIVSPAAGLPPFEVYRRVWRFAGRTRSLDQQVGRAFSRTYLLNARRGSNAVVAAFRHVAPEVLRLAPSRIYRVTLAGGEPALQVIYDLLGPCGLREAVALVEKLRIAFARIR